MATHSSMLAWEMPWTEEPGGVGSRESDTSSGSRRTVFSQPPYKQRRKWEFLFK